MVIRIVLVAVILAALAAGQESFRIIHLTDTHVGAVNGAAMLRKAVDEINAISPKVDLVVVTGDLTEFGTDEEFATYANEIARLTVPVYSIPGNHDRRWRRKPYPTWLLTEFYEERGRALFFGFDSAIPEDQHGCFRRETEESLRAKLQAQPKERLLLIFCHHPFGFPAQEYGTGTGRLVELLAGRNVLLVTGHGHSNRFWRLGDIEALMTKNLYDGWYRVLDVSVGNSTEITLYTKQIGKEPVKDAVWRQGEWLLAEGAGVSKNQGVWKETTFQRPVADRVWEYGKSFFRQPTGIGKDGNPVFDSATTASDASQAEGGIVVQTAEGRWIGDWIAGGLFQNETGEAKFFTGRSRYYGAGATIPATSTIDGNPAAVWTLPMNSSDTKNSVVLVQIKQEMVRIYDQYSHGFGDEVASIAATEVWGRRLNCGYSSPTIDGERVFVTTVEGDIHCLSLKDGRTLWQGELGGVTAANQVTVTEELCAALTLRGRVTVFRKDTGEKVAQFELPGGYCFGKPLMSGEFVYLANTEGVVARFLLQRR